MNSVQLRDQIAALFRQYQAGDKDALLALIEIQRPQMFDYAFRMTGQRDTSLKVFDEVAAVMYGEDPTQFEKYENLLVRLFATVRSFGSHIWNADTSQLINEGYDNFDYPALGPNLSDLTVRRVETSIAALPAWEKEPLILKARFGFTAAMIAEVMSSNEQGIKEGMNNAYIKIAQVCQIEPKLIDRAIRAIPAHPLTGGTMHSTAALSQIMGDIEQSRGKTSISKTLTSLLLLLVMIGLGAYVAFNYRHLIP
jgi:DNA-directed RNA polymerase specialized sigma24 family protein